MAANRKTLVQQARSAPPLMRPRDLGRIFGLTPPTIYRHITKNTRVLPPPLPKRTAGEAHTWLRDDVIKWLEDPSVR